jgi:hypothetical protein
MTLTGSGKEIIVAAGGRRWPSLPTMTLTGSGKEIIVAAGGRRWPSLPTMTLTGSGGTPLTSSTRSTALPDPA